MRNAPAATTSGLMQINSHLAQARFTGIREPIPDPSASTCRWAPGLRLTACPPRHLPGMPWCLQRRLQPALRARPAPRRAPHLRSGRCTGTCRLVRQNRTLLAACRPPPRFQSQRRDLHGRVAPRRAGRTCQRGAPAPQRHAWPHRGVRAATPPAPVVPPAPATPIASAQLAQRGHGDGAAFALCRATPARSAHAW